MRWVPEVLDDMVERLGQLGLRSCPTCTSQDSLVVDQRPGLLPVGGWTRPKDSPRRDPDANLIFLVIVKCRLCGHLQLFDSEEFYDGDQPTLVRDIEP